MSKDMPAQPQGRDGNGKIVCIICNALFAPSPQEQAASSIALESAFLSMCHFCFRCRRPACPQCWDEVHAICGACVKETGLVFRTSATPLSDPLFAQVRQQFEREWKGQQGSYNPQTGHEGKPQSAGASKMPMPLVCLRPGKFSTLPIEAQATLPELPSIKETSPHLQAQRAPIAAQPVGMLNAASPEPTHEYSPVQFGKLLSLPFLPAPPAALGYTPPTSLPAQRVPTPQPQQVESEPLVKAESPHPSPFRRRTNGALIVLFILLIIIVLLAAVIIAALLSTQINSFISQTVHINIQAGIASLLRFFEHLRP